MERLLNLLLLFAGALLAVGNTHASVNPGKMAALLEIAGQQRMLSQRIARNYLYQGLGIRPAKTRRQMLEALGAFSEASTRLKRETSDRHLHDMLQFLDVNLAELQALVRRPYSSDTARLVLDYSELLLEGSRNVTERLREMAGTGYVPVVELAGRQRMLSQRIARCYIAYQAGFRDTDTRAALGEALREFEATHETLMNHPRNTPGITAELVRMKTIWKTARRFYERVEHANLSAIVLATTDDFALSMDRVIRMYIALVEPGAADSPATNLAMQGG